MKINELQRMFHRYGFYFYKNRKKPGYTLRFGYVSQSDIENNNIPEYRDFVIEHNMQYLRDENNNDRVYTLAQLRSFATNMWGV